MTQYIEETVKLNSELTVNGDLIISPYSFLLVNSNVKVNGSLIVDHNASISVTGSLEANSIDVGHSSSINAKTLTSNWSMTLSSFSLVDVMSTMIVKGDIIAEKGKLHSSKTIIQGSVRLKSSKLTTRDTTRVESIHAFDSIMSCSNELIVKNDIQLVKSRIVTNEGLEGLLLNAKNSILETDMTIKEIVLIATETHTQKTNITLGKILGGTVMANKLVSNELIIKGDSRVEIQDYTKISNLLITDSEVILNDSLEIDSKLVLKRSRLIIAKNMSVKKETIIKTGMSMISNEDIEPESKCVCNVQGDILLDKLVTEIGANIQTNKLEATGIDTAGTISTQNIICKEEILNRGKIIVNDSLVAGAIHNHGRMTVSKCVTSQWLTCEANSNISIHTNACIDTVSLTNYGRLEVTGTLTTEAINIHSSSMHIIGSLKTDALTMNRDSNIEIDGDAYVKNNVYMDLNSKLTVNSSLTLKGGLTMKHKSELRIHNNAYVLGDINSIYTSSIHCVNNVYVHGNLCVDTNVPISDHRSEFVKLTGNINKPGNMPCIDSIVCDNLLVKAIRKIHQPTHIKINTIQAGSNSQSELDELVQINRDIHYRLKTGAN